MSGVNRMWIELEIGSDGPSGTAHDHEGRKASFSGWLELIAVIQTPPPATGEVSPREFGTAEPTT